MIPQNYYCKFDIMVEETVLKDDEMEEVDWELVIYRYYSMFFTEQIYLQVETEKVSQYSDDYLREKSYINTGAQYNYTS